MDALQYVREQLKQDGINLREVAKGAGVGDSWLRMFARGEIPDPAYSRIKKLADYFLRVGLNGSPTEQHAAWDGQDRRNQHASGGRKGQMC